MQVPRSISCQGETQMLIRLLETIPFFLFARLTKFSNSDGLSSFQNMTRRINSISSTITPPPPRKSNAKEGPTDELFISSADAIGGSPEITGLTTCQTGMEEALSIITMNNRSIWSLRKQSYFMSRFHNH